MLLLRTLLSHYRRHRVQALFLLIGIVIANVLLVATLLINAQARASYAKGERLMHARPVAYIEAANGADTIDERDYIQLRRAGFEHLAPLLRRFVLTAGGQPIELLGIDAFAMPRVPGPVGAANGTTVDYPIFAVPPFQVWAAPARLEQLGWTAGSRPVLGDGQMLPPLVALLGRDLGHRLFIDIGALQVLTDNPGVLSRIMVFDAGEERLQVLRNALPASLSLHRTAEPLDQAQLTRSFHLNLAAMGLLAFVVGIFLTYNAVAFSYTDRAELLRKLKLCGVTHAELTKGLLIELGLFVVAGVVLGYWLGSWLALQLLPGVGLTLAQLYGVYIDYPDRVIHGGLGLPLVMTAIAVVLCVLFPMRMAVKAPALRRREPGWQEHAMWRRDRGLLKSGLLLTAVSATLGFIALNHWPELWLGLACMACLLLGAALCVPMVVRGLLGLIWRRVPPSWPRTRWLLVDTRWLLGPASLALMAMTLALVANSGLNTMISSFRDATDKWLGQRLVAQLYLSGTNTRELEDWIGRHAPGVRIAQRYETELERSTPAGRKVRVEVISLPSTAPFVDSVGLVDALPEAMNLFLGGEGLFISERNARLDGWRLGDRVNACEGIDGVPVVVPVIGVYRDYGNPHSQWMMSEPRFRRCWPEVQPSGMALYGPDNLDWTGIELRLVRDLGLNDRQLIDQHELKDIAMSVFDRTFTVTHALNTLTLLVAGIGIFCAVSAIHHHRLHQQALLASLGISRRERAMMQLAQWGLLGLLCLLVVWPFGTALAWVLAQIVTPVAFGWSFSLQPNWTHYPTLVLMTFGCLLLAVVLPGIRLLRTSPALMLREEVT